MKQALRDLATLWRAMPRAERLAMPVIVIGTYIVAAGIAAIG